MSRNIITISGGGFSEQEHALIDAYILSLKRTQSPIKIGFIGTASNDAAGYIEKFYTAFQAEAATHFPIAAFTKDSIQQEINALDIIYVGGGNTTYMLDIWRQTGFDHVLKNAYEHGVILAGISAGAMCWFEKCLVEVNGQHQLIEGLGLLKGILCPHYNDETYATPFEQFVTNYKLAPIYRFHDEDNLHFRNERCIAKITTY